MQIPWEDIGVELDANSLSELDKNPEASETLKGLCKFLAGKRTAPSATSVAEPGPQTTSTLAQATPTAGQATPTAASTSAAFRASSKRSTRDPFAPNLTRAEGRKRILGFMDTSSEEEEISQGT